VTPVTQPDRALVSACTVSDAMGQLGLSGTISSLTAAGSGGVVVGPAYTARFVANGSGAFNNYLSSVPSGSVIVLDVGGRTDVSAWGGLIGAEARRRGVLGTVVNGACRDVAELAEIGYQVFSLGVSPASGRGVISSDETQVALVIEAVTVHPGDTVVADGDGAVIVPRERSDEVLALARAIGAKDEAIKSLILSGTSLEEARAQVG
jgi:4-hydroxy-4-methyl-2-oxoglutarate aldolase